MEILAVALRNYVKALDARQDHQGV